MKLLLAALAAGLMLVFSGVAASASSYDDAIGDANTPADIRAVTVGESAGTVEVTVDVANFRSLPATSSLTLWFDSDANPGTGNADGLEARVRYEASGTIGLQVWNGARLADRTPAGMSATFADGRLSLSAAASTLGIGGVFALLVVSARGQPAAGGEFVSSDVAPDSGLLTYSGPGASTVVDRAGDHESAPDLGRVAVSDAADGWVSVTVAIPNADALPRAPLVGLSIDADDDARTGDSGADLAITALGGEVVADRWSERARSWIPDGAAKVRVGSSGGSVTIGVHASELGASPRFGFAVLAAGVAGSTFTGIDVAPDGFSFFRYVFQNRPRVRVLAGKVVFAPSGPRAGRRLVVRASVTRSDTRSAPRTAVVACRASVAGKRLTGTGVYSGGRVSCAFAIPRSGRRVVGTIAVRADGVATSIPFSAGLRRASVH